MIDEKNVDRKMEKVMSEKPHIEETFEKHPKKRKMS